MTKKALVKKYQSLGIFPKNWISHTLEAWISRKSSGKHKYFL